MPIPSYILSLDEIQQWLHNSFSLQYLSCNCNSLSTSHTVCPDTKTYPRGRKKSWLVSSHQWGAVECFVDVGNLNPCNHFRQVVSRHTRKSKWRCSQNYANPCKIARGHPWIGKNAVQNAIKERRPIPRLRDMLTNLLVRDRFLPISKIDINKCAPANAYPLIKLIPLKFCHRGWCKPWLTVWLTDVISQQVARDPRLQQR